MWKALIVSAIAGMVGTTGKVIAPICSLETLKSGQAIKKFEKDYERYVNAHRESDGSGMQTVVACIEKDALDFLEDMTPGGGLSMAKVPGVRKMARAAADRQRP